MSRPLEIPPLYRRFISLQNIGSKTAGLMEKLLKSPYLIDLLLHFPTGLIDRSYAPKLNQLVPGGIATLTLWVKSYSRSAGRKGPFKVQCMDETGTIDLLFFRLSPAQIEKMLPIGEKRQISGKVDYYNNKPQIVHPDRITVAPEEQAEKAEKIENTMGGGVEALEPNYPLTAGLTLNMLRKAILEAIEQSPELPEWYGKEFLRVKGFPSWREALQEIHFPKGERDLLPSSKARQRIAFDEILAHQLALSEMRKHYKKQAGISTKSTGHLREKLLASLPFSLTKSQEDAAHIILKDIEAPTRMLRLLQGDVGCGKTIMCLIAMLTMVESKRQAALMAPTEILAKQHFYSLQKDCEPLGIKLALLTGKDKAAARRQTLQALKEGEVDILIGTHALFQDEVIFKDLGLVIIDEQHRFGVEQRFRLTSKGAHTDVLAMTATPIPRTLALTQYGDMDITQITEKPPGRQPILTSLLSLDRLDELIPAIERALNEGTQIYWVCPLIEESETLDLAAAKERFIFLQTLFEGQVALLHGQCKSDEKEAVMKAFTAGAIKILVATTVIEVGVNVPNANIMIIEHAERYGLSQLHQLRGRVGRGTQKAHTILLYSAPLNPIARRRLQIMRESNDGFYIAEQDLKLRGTGDILGTKQSGMPAFKNVDFNVHEDLIYEAYKMVKDIKSYKLLLYLYGHEKVLQGELKN